MSIDNQNNRPEVVLQDYQKYRDNVQELLREARMPENLIQLQTMVLPEMSALLPEEVEQIFQDIKRLTVLYYHARGFSQREITRRLGGQSLYTVNKMIKEVYEDNQTDIPTK